MRITIQLQLKVSQQHQQYPCFSIAAHFLFPELFRMASKESNVGINGFGRIGRLFFRAALMHKNDYHFHVTAINDPQLDLESMMYLLKYDSVHGKLPFDVCTEGKDTLCVGSCKVKVFHFDDPSQIPWRDCGVEIVAETSGMFVTCEKANAHMKSGPCQVVLSAPAHDNTTPTFCMGVNHKAYHPDMKVVSNGSCTTNCFAPLAKLLNDCYGIEEGLMTTVHAVTATQNTVDGPTHRCGDMRGGRAYGLNIIPSTTGAAESVTKCIPELEGKISGMSLRVPVENVSVLDFTCKLTRGMNSLEDFCNCICNIEKDKTHDLYGIIGVTCDPVVSSDFNGDKRSCIVDMHASMLLNPTFVKIIAYYDNEWAYANRLVY